MVITQRPHLCVLEYTNDTINVSAECPLCGDTRELETLDFSALHSWLTGGTLIQVAFPNLNASTREALMTGMCDDCWETLGDDA